jgi:hypothetical protein
MIQGYAVKKQIGTSRDLSLSIATCPYLSRLVPIGIRNDHFDIGGQFKKIKDFFDGYINAFEYQKFQNICNVKLFPAPLGATYE